jgi:hypothetical protein
MRVDDFFGDGVCAYIGKGANAYFHGAKVGRESLGHEEAEKGRGTEGYL